MSEVDAKVVTMIKVCPEHGGGFDCTPFCSICEGEQEYESNGLLPCRECGVMIDDDVYAEEMGMCIDCSNAYYQEG